MDFVPTMREPPRLMDAGIFHEEPMGLRERMLTIPLERRFTYDAEQNLFLVNFERLYMKSLDDVNKIRQQLERILSPLGKKVYAIVNYDNFNLLPEVADAYMDMVNDVVERYYIRVTRYTTSAFLRVKLGDAMTKRGVAPHIFESAEEAQARVRDEG